MANLIRSIPRFGKVNKIFSFKFSYQSRSFSGVCPALKGIDSKKIIPEASNRKGRNSKWETSYSQIGQKEAFKRLGLNLEEFSERRIPVRRLIQESNCQIEGIGNEEVTKIKEQVYDRIVEYIQIEGFPSEASLGFKEMNVNDLVLFILGPIILKYQSATGRKIRLHREMELVAPDTRTGGYEEFVIVDNISIKEHRFVLVIECKESALGHGIRQCLLALYDMFCLNRREGKLYGFVTTGEQWRMVTYDGTTLQMTDPFFALFGKLRQEKQRWMEEFSVVVDCLLIALHNAGTQKGNEDV